MAQNTAPIFTQTPNIGFGIIGATQNNDYNMITGVSASVFTAGASGSYVTKIRVKPSGSTAAATVLRFFLNNGGATTNSANNSLFAELSIPVITASTTLAQNDFETPLNIALPANWKIFGVSAGSGLTGGFEVTTIGGDY